MAVAFADALAPDRQADSILEVMRFSGFLDPRYISLVSLNDVASDHCVFDIGDSIAFTELEQAHRRIRNTLTNAADNFFWLSLRGGQVSQQDSAQLLGIQAADIAARIAADIYEESPDDRIVGAKTLKNSFERVLLNDRWM